MLTLLRRLTGRPVSAASDAAGMPGPEPSGADVEGTDIAPQAPERLAESASPELGPAEPETPPAPSVACPYCAVALTPPPPRTRRCPSCRQQVIVRRVDGQTRHLTEAAAAVLEAQRHREADEKAWTAARRHWLDLARSVRAPADLLAQVAAMPLGDRAVEGARAVYRTAADQAVREARAGEHWVQVGRLRAIEADALYQDAGRPVPPPDDIVAVYRESRSAVLHSLAMHSPVAELAGGTCCKACRADDGALATISVELRKPRLPHAGCPRGLCDCDWVLAVPAPRTSRKRRRRTPTGTTVGTGT